MTTRRQDRFARTTPPPPRWRWHTELDWTVWALAIVVGREEIHIAIGPVVCGWMKW